MGCKYLTHEENRRKEEREGEREKEEGEGCQSAVASVTAVVRHSAQPRMEPFAPEGTLVHVSPSDTVPWFARQTPFRGLRELAGRSRFTA